LGLGEKICYHLFNLAILKNPAFFILGKKLKNGVKNKKLFEPRRTNNSKPEKESKHICT
jgi:hypothetical protein